jgi:ubiquinol-cytochrome c reductase cytochrome c1 subunit
MKRKLIAFLVACMPVWACAAGGEVHLDRANIDLTDRQSLQRGAKLFVNYCFSCHSANYMRYNRMGRDLGLTAEQVSENLKFNPDAKIGGTMTIAMPMQAAKAWFGVAPPDLSVIARSRGVDWLYTYLRSFYLDDTRALGVNNLVFPGVGMPHVLWELQGWQKAVYKTETDENGHEREVFEKMELVKPGRLEPAEYDRSVRDLVNFLAYMGEPAKLERKQIGYRVILFLIVFLVVAYLLKKEYWKDVH